MLLQQSECFNPRPRTGGDRSNIFLPRKIHVSTHAPARGATIHLPAGWVSVEGFNPRPRTGGDEALSSILPAQPVSTHAPARGATLDVRRLGRVHVVSTHAPAREPLDGRVTGGPDRVQPPRGDFTFRAEYTYCRVSTHAPHGRPSMYAGSDGSRRTHAPHGGRRWMVGSRAVPTRVSTHAPARGATFYLSGGIYLLPSFNPRPRTGGDPCWIIFFTFRAVSTHAPARGATITAYRSAAGRNAFQPTPPHGGRRLRRKPSRPPGSFNPRPRSGGDV